MTEEPRKRYSADSLVKIILIGSLAFALIVLTSAMTVRALLPQYQIDSEFMARIFDQFIGLFGVVVGYVLGSKVNKD